MTERERLLSNYATFLNTSLSCFSLFEGNFLFYITLLYMGTILSAQQSGIGISVPSYIYLTLSIPQINLFYGNYKLFIKIFVNLYKKDKLRYI